MAPLKLTTSVEMGQRPLFVAAKSYSVAYPPDSGCHDSPTGVTTAVAEQPGPATSAECEGVAMAEPIKSPERRAKAENFIVFIYMCIFVALVLGIH